MKQKYNWDKLKLDYFSSPVMEVKDFFQYQYSTYSGHIKQKTIGWRKEKDGIIKHCSKLAKQEIQEELKELYKTSSIELSKMHETTMILFKSKLFNLAQNVSKDEKGNIILPENLNLKELKIIWEIVKTELWEPIKISNKKLYNYQDNLVSEIKIVREP